MPEQTLAIVGNAPSSKDNSAQIDGADIVVRFNNALMYDGFNGNKTDYVSLVNTGGQAKEWLEDPKFINRAYLLDAHTVLLPNDPKRDSHLEFSNSHTNLISETWHYTDELYALLKNTADIHIISDELYIEACDAIKLPTYVRNKKFLSTGFITTYYLFKKYPRYQFYIFGFTWTGWPNHPWSYEKKWFLAMQTHKKFKIFAP